MAILIHYNFYKTTMKFHAQFKVHKLQLVAHIIAKIKYQITEYTNTIAPVQSTWPSTPSTTVNRTRETSRRFPPYFIPAKVFIQLQLSREAISFPRLYFFAQHGQTNLFFNLVPAGGEAI